MCIAARCARRWCRRSRRSARRPSGTPPALGPWVMVIRAWLVADREAPRKQRHTARRVWQRLVAEYGAQVAESTVRAYVAQVNFELDNTLRMVTVPQTHGPGEEAECDFGEFMAWIEGVLVKCWMFCLRLSHIRAGASMWRSAIRPRRRSSRGTCWPSPIFGAVPARIRYDNLKAAVIKVLLGRDRLENERFVALRSHYGFDSFYCLPGIEGSHEKGGVEGEVGRFRRRHLVPVPRVASLAELNELIAAGDRRRRRASHRPSSAECGRSGRGRAGLAAAPARRALRLGHDPAGGEGGHQGPDLCAPELLLGPGRAWPGARSRCAWAPMSSRRSPTAGWWPAMCAACTRAPRTWCWTTTWRSWSASPGPCPARPRWPRPAPAGAFGASP